jgi:hypothetical protein
MSRTYRRKECYDASWSYLLSEWVALEGYAHIYRRRLTPASLDYKKAKAHYHSDKTSKFKEPGPSWFRNMFSERPLRRRNRRELLRFARVPEYEPMVFDKYPLDYWT